MKKLFFILTFLICFGFKSTYSQTFTLVHDIYYSTENQNMWGPNGDPFSIDTLIELFYVDWDEQISVGYIEDIFGFQFGAMIDIDTWGEIGAYFSLTGFQTGSVDVDYPVRIYLTFPDDYTFNPGEIITINSYYEVLPGWFLHTHFPTAGVFTLWLDFGFGLDMDATICVFTCTTIPIFDINLPTDSITLFYINSITGEAVYPCWVDPPGYPDICTDMWLPIVIEDWWGIGLTGEITIPYVETIDYLDLSDKCLYANGDSTWLWFNLDIIEFLSFLAGYFYPPLVPILDNLSGTYDFGFLYIEYDLLGIDMLMSSTMQQDFTFCPTLWTTLAFPTSLDYWEIDPSNGSVVASGNSNIITFQVDHDLDITYPCFGYPPTAGMDIGIAHSLTNDFTNHTWDSIAFDFLFTAFEFWIVIPGFKVLPDVTIPEFCLIAPYPCLESEDPSDICSKEVCSPEIFTPEVVTKGYEAHVGPLIQFHISTIDTVQTDTMDMMLKDIVFHIGPLVDITIPLGYLPLTWYNNTWDLEGFEDTIFPGTQIIPNPEMITTISGTDVLCTGDSSGVIVITVEYGTPPYTFEYSNGITHVSSSNIDSILVTSGAYSVTITDANGCSLTEQIDIFDINPELFISLSATDVLCNGYNTGTITATVSGGTQPYTYLWTPSSQTDSIATNLYAGTYTVVVTDAIGCTISDTITVNEPPMPLTASIIGTDVPCFGDSTGAADLTVLGGTPGYTYLWNLGQTTEDLIDIIAGTYIVTVTDANSCTITTYVIIHQPDKPLALYIEGTDVSCFGFADGIADLTVEGGTPPYSYFWNGSETTEDLTGLVGGTYSVTVTDAHFCTDTASVTLTEPSAPLAVSITGTDVLCYGDNSGTVDITVSGGTIDYTYLWSDSSTTEDLPNVYEGTYTVTVTDAHFCTETASITIAQPPKPLNGEIIGTTDILCFGESTGAADLDVTGGTPGYSYIWSSGQTTEDLSDVLAGTYTVTVTDANLCTFTTFVILNQPTNLLVNTSPTTTVCIGEAAPLFAQGIGGTFPYSYFWSNDDDSSSTTFYPTVPVTVSVTVTDAHNCTVVGYININLHDSINIVLSTNNDSICFGDPAIITATVTGGSGVFPYYSNLGNIDSSIHDFIVYPNVSQTYYITVTDSCTVPTASASIYFEVLPLPPNDFSSDIVSGCEPLTVHFIESSIDEGQTYLWDFGDNGTSTEKNPEHTFVNVETYDITLTVTSIYGCNNSVTNEDMITVHPNPEASFIANPQTVSIIKQLVFFENQSDYTDTCYGSFGDGSFSNETSPEHLYNSPGIYAVQLIIATQHGCRDTAYSTPDIVVKDEFTFYAPTAFSPDQDGINEVFVICGSGIDDKNFYLVIYDRWGEKVFESFDKEHGWDGKVKERKMAENGIYTWMVIYQDLQGIEHKETGAVTLIR